MRFLTYALILSATLLVAQTTLAQGASSLIDATVKVSVCGNGEKEGGEDCDGADLNAATCASAGYAEGTLSCTVACEYDVGSCVYLSPTPTPFVTPTPTVNPSSSPTPTSSSQTPTAAPTPTPSVTPSVNLGQIIRTTPIPVQIIPSLPALLQAFDQNGDGVIASNELFDAVNNWVESWRQNQRSLTQQNGQDAVGECDLNGDNTCDILDFSIVMFFAQQ